MSCYFNDGTFVEVKEDKVAKCFYCGEEKQVDYICSNNPEHFFCEDCRIADPNDLIPIVASRGVKDIVKDVNGLMAHPSFDLYSPLHHPLVSALYYSYLCNITGKNVDPNVISKVIRKAKKYELGSCGRRGVCGAVGGLGVAISTFMGATEETPEERNISLKIVGKTLGSIAELALPRCCKLSVYMALEIANKELKKYYDLPELKIKCMFQEDCDYRNECPYGDENGRS